MEKVDPGSIPGRVKAKPTKISIHNFPCSALKEQNAPAVCGSQVDRW